MLAGSAFAGEPLYPASAIPAALKKDAHVVVRTDETAYEISDPGNMRYTHHYVLTVLDEGGADDVKFSEDYSKNFDIRSISGALYDAEGKLVKRLKQSDIKDFGSPGEASLMTDTRYKVHEFNYNVYPYTVEYEVEMKVKSAFYMQRWIPQVHDDWTIEQAQLTITTPADFKLMYRNYLYNGQPETATDKDLKTYKWTVKQVPALKEENYAAEIYKRTTCVLLAAGQFQMDRYQGSLNSWKDFGAFGYQLNEGRDVLPDNMKQKVHQLTDGLSTEKEKISVLYKYLQQNYRYISIQLGIGGLQTFDAVTVNKTGYGDCKALSNYMMAMLKEAGIRSNCVWIRAGETERSFPEDFPLDWFNHVILCVPGKDTTWLECTSGILQPGYLGSFTANRPALLLDAQSSQLVHTPAYGIEQNQQLRRIDAVVAASGDIDITAVTLRTGELQDDQRAELHYLSREKRLERLKSSLDLSSYDIVDYNCKELETALPSIEEQLKIAGHSYATVTGKRMFLVPDILSRTSIKLDKDTARQSPIRFITSTRIVDTVVIKIPEGYKLETLPAPVMMKNKFGAYTSMLSVKDNTITYIRKLEHYAGSFPPSDYPELLKFRNTIYKADRSRVVLVKEE